jgi:hypothetical protein
MKAELLKGDRRTRLVSDWQNWMNCAAEISERFWNYLHDNPFGYNETATVSLMAAAAGRAGFLSLAEYRMAKRRKADLRQRDLRARVDFWMSNETDIWEFECKNLIAGSPNLRSIRRLLENAFADATALVPDRDVLRVACVTVSCDDWARDEWGDDESRYALEDSVLKDLKDDSSITHIWRISGNSAQPSTYFLFRVL